jgi:nicotinate-nucleotide adenylyltransferase
MAALAVQEIPGFKVLDIEVNRPGPSYTIDTLHSLKKLHPDPRFHLLLADDTALTFPEWKSALEIVELLPLRIGRRKGIDLKDYFKNRGLPAPLLKALLEGWVETSLMEVEATTIRKRLEKRLYCGHLVPSKVLDYIYQNQLYYTP